MTWLISLIIFILPTYLVRFNIFKIPSTLLELSIYAVFLVEIAKVVFLKKRIQKLSRSWIIAIVLFITAAIVSVFVSDNRTMSLGILKGWIIDPIILFLLVFNNVKSTEDIIRIMKSISLSAFILSLIGLWQYFTHTTLTEDGRLSSVFSSANYFAMYLGPILPMIIYLIAKDKNLFSKIIWSLIFLVVVLAFFLTKSYAGWIAIFVTTIIGIIYFIKSKWKYLVLVIFIGLVGLFAYSQKDTVKFQQVFVISNRSTSQARIEIWRTAWYMIKKEPILGIGLGNFQEKYIENVSKVVFPPIDWTAPEPHNIFFAFWLNMGLLGIVSFIYILYLFFISIVKLLKGKNKILGFFILLSMIMIIFHGLLDTPYWKNDFAIEFWLLIALPLVLANTDKGKI